MKTKPVALVNSLPRPQTTLPWLCLILIALTAYRFLALRQADLPLYFDEAYYWGWSLEPAFGYYSKPPMIAWTIRLATSLCGDSELCIHSPPLLLYPLTSLVIYAIGCRLFSTATGFVSALVFISLPLVSFYSWLTTTDGLLLFFWALALYGFIRAVETDAWRDWCGLGLALGLGLLSKYTASLFLVSVLLAGLIVPHYRARLASRRAIVALLVALLVFMPNLIWNGSMQFASFRHTAEIAHWDKNLFHPDHLLAFWGVQILLLGPGLCLAIGQRVRQLPRSLWTEGPVRLMLMFTVPVLLLYSLQAVVARANYNWAMAAYVAASLLIGTILVRTSRQHWLAAIVAINLLTGSLIYHYGDWLQAAGIPLNRKNDIYHSMKGWRELATQTQTFRNRYPAAGFMSDNRRILAELNYYLNPRPRDAVIWNPDGKITDHYRLTADLRHSPRPAFIFVATETPPERLAQSFATVTRLGTLRVQVHADYGMEYPVYHLEGFRGYGTAEPSTPPP